MILYQGMVYPNTQQSTLMAQLEEDCIATLESPFKLTSSLVIDACDRLTQRVLEGDFDEVVQPMLKAHDLTQETFLNYVSRFTKDALLTKLTLELGSDHQALSPLDASTSRRLEPLGILFHIAAGNLDILPAYSVIEGLLVGNINILKLPSGDQGVSVKLLSALMTIEPKLKPYIYVFDVPSTDLESLRQFAALADGVVVWGGDEAIQAARQMTLPNTKLIEWGHKISFAYASMEAEDEDLEALAAHIIKTNQLLCSSAQGIYVDTASEDELHRFARRFFDLFKRTQETAAEVPIGMRVKHALELHYHTMRQFETNTLVLRAPGVSVVASRDSTLEASLGFRHVWVKRLPKDAILKTLKPYKNHLQTACVCAPKTTYEDIVDRLIRSGVVRIKAASEMSESLLGESHDGMFPLRLYTKVVERYHKH